MSSGIAAKEGFVSFRGFKVWYRIVGGPELSGKFPLLCLHGGPGATHDYLEPLEAIAATGRRVIFYDQLGSGNSDHPHNPAMWNVELFLEELEIVRNALGLERLQILGQSWGGMLAMEYSLKKPKGLASLVLADTLASVHQWVSETNRLRSQLSPDVQRVLSEHEETGTTDDPAYEEAMMVFYRRHVCRLNPWPDCLNRTFKKMTMDPEVYHTMFGPSEFHVTGSLRDWDIVDRLGEIEAPALVLSGLYDEATPVITETVHRGIKGSVRVLFENCSHMPHLEETEKYLSVVEEFLDKAES